MRLAVIATVLSSAAVAMVSIHQASAKVCISDSSNDNNRKSNNNYDHHTVSCTPQQYPMRTADSTKVKTPFLLVIPFP
jgi:ABC-type branched-subunit amino acid transport system substrate-binding protein